MHFCTLSQGKDHFLLSNQLKIDISTRATKQKIDKAQNEGLSGWWIGLVTYLVQVGAN